MSNLQSGDICGLGALGKTNGNIAVTCNSPGNFTLSMNLIVPTDSTNTNLARRSLPPHHTQERQFICARVMDFIKSLGTLLYSADGITWTQLGGQFNIAYDWATGTFQGEQFAMFCYNPQPGTGYLDVDWFRFMPPAFINSIIRNPDSSTTLYFANSPGSTNIIQAATDLSTWENVSTNLADENGFWQFTDTNASTVPSQFYRSSTR